MIRRPPRSTLSSSSAASDVYKRQHKFPTFKQSHTAIKAWLFWLYDLHGFLFVFVTRMTFQFLWFKGQSFTLFQSCHTLIMLIFLSCTVITCAVKFFKIFRFSICCNNPFVISENHFTRAL